MSKYHNDQPIKGGSDDPDLLNRAFFANNLANILLLNPKNDCLIVSLEGEWGYGKTSIINLAKEALKEKPVIPIIVEYNPWLAGKPESLIQDFLIQFSSQLNIIDNSKEALKVTKEVLAYADLFSVAKLIPGAEPWASITEKVFKKTGSATKKIAELKKLDVLAKKEKVKKIISKINTPIIVFIDDIDRLTPEETFQVLRLVKSIADFSGTAFLLSFDPQYISSALKKHHIDKYNEYIDKVVQLRVPLPIISDRDLNKLANIEIENLSDKNLTDSFEQDNDRLGWMYHHYFKNLIKNPRELKRFFNHLRFILEQVEGNVCFSDLFGLSLIAIKANSIYEHIKSNPELYIGKRFNTDGVLFEKPDEIVEKGKFEREKILQTFTDSKQKLIGNLLGVLFPLIETDALNPYEVSSDDRAGRISAPQRLYVALHYQIPTGYLSDSDILSFINGDVDRTEFVKEILSSDSESRFFELLTHYIDKCSNYASDILFSIYDIYLHSDQLMRVLKENFGFSIFNPFQQMIWLTDNIISKKENKEDLILSIITRADNAPISADLIFRMRRQIQKQQEGNEHQKVWVDSTKFKELEDEFVNIAFSVLNKKIFLNSTLESEIFYELKRSSIEKTTQLFDKILRSDEGIVRIAEIIAHSGTDSVNGPYAHLKDGFFNDIVDIQVLHEKANKALTQPDQLPISVQATLNSILDGKKYYLRDGKQRSEWD